TEKEETEEKEDESPLKKANLNDVLSRLIPEFAILSGCKTDLLESIQAILSIPTQHSAINDFLIELYSQCESTSSSSYSPLTILGNLVQRHYKNLNDAREIFEIISSITGNPEWHTNIRANFQIILPIAISFYSFQIIAFVVDKYRGEIPEHTTFVEFSLFIFFFPQQLAGPILKANEFFPRLHSPKEVTKEDVEIGLYYILLGVIKKGVFADSLAYAITPIFANPSQYNAISLFLAILGFLFQLWGDFAGYCDIAIGCGKLLGFDLPNNFNRPFYSVRFSEMWLRWHITLSRFLRDYIYFPMGGSKYGEFRTTFNSAFTMVIAGIWHGANWNYILWGVVIAISLILERQVLDRFEWWKLKSEGRDKFIKNCVVLLFWLVLSIIFRANQLSDIPIFLTRIF
ncbi:MAG: MBOAT family protein, partial [Spirochaetia bacterium]|nr:MBOAT family protein [Spirochaetia bacterium]